MTPARHTLAATVMLCLCVAGLILSATFGPEPSDALFGFVFVAYAAVGWLITRHRPGNSVGWLLLAFGVVGGTSGFLAAWQTAAVAWDLPGVALSDWSQSWLWAPMLGVTFGPLLALFPDGRLLSKRWSAVLWLSGAFTVLAGIGNAFYPIPADQGGPNPYAIEGLKGVFEVVRGLGGIALVGALLGGVAALVVRYRRGSRTQRQQLKWFLAAAALLPVMTVVGETNNQAYQDIAVPLGLSLLAPAIGIAILRHGLYDIDRIISRTVGWALVTVVIAGVYLVVVTVLTSVTAKLAGDSPLAVAAATLLAAAAFKPARLRIQSAVDRRFNRARYDAAETVEAYRGQLRDDLDVASVSAHLTAAVALTLQPSQSLLWLRSHEVRR